MMMMALEVRGLVHRFGSLLTTDNVNLKLTEGTRHALIGPNGAGKTSLINLLSGRLHADAGAVMLMERDVTHLSERARCRQGLIRTFQISEPFRQMTVLESVALAISERRSEGWRFWRPLLRDRSVVAEAVAVLSRLDLIEVAEKLVGRLAYGQQRVAEIALALAARPKVLLLDEPAAGIGEADSRRVYDTIQRLPANVTVLLIEHDMDLVFRFADRITVMAAGRIVAEGTPVDIVADREVRRIYLGEDNDERATG